MKRILSTAAVTAMLMGATMPALAQSAPLAATTQCYEFLNMTAEEQMLGMESLVVAPGEVGSGTANADSSGSGDAASTNAGESVSDADAMQVHMQAMIAKCQENPNMMASEALADTSTN